MFGLSVLSVSVFKSELALKLPMAFSLEPPLSTTKFVKLVVKLVSIASLSLTSVSSCKFTNEPVKSVVRTVAELSTTKFFADGAVEMDMLKCRA